MVSSAWTDVSGGNVSSLHHNLSLLTKCGLALEKPLARLPTSFPRPASCDELQLRTSQCHLAAGSAYNGDTLLKSIFFLSSHTGRPEDTFSTQLLESVARVPDVTDC